MILRSNVFYPMTRLRGEVERLFDEVTRDFPTFGRMTGPHGRGFPSLNVWEDEQNLYAEAEVPGMSMDDLEVTVLGNELAIKGRRKEPLIEDATYHRRERGLGPFSRVLRLPVQVDSDQVRAGLLNGVLTVTLPKAVEARPRKIEVKTSR